LDPGKIRPEGSSISPSELSWPSKRPEWHDISSALSFQLARFAFLFIEDLEQGKDTEIRGLAGVGRRRQESDKNDSLGTSIGGDARSTVTGVPVDQKDNGSIIVSSDA
jgi:hypothetical protein